VSRIIAIAIVIVICALGLVQVGSDGLLGQAAVTGSFPRVVPRELGEGIYDALARVSFLTFARRITIETAIDDRNFARAQSLIDSLSAGPDRDELQGRLDDALGDHVRALQHFVAAGDLVRVSQAVDRLDRQGQTTAALDTQRHLVAALEKLDDKDSLAHAYWRLGQLESETGDHRASLAAYDQAITLEPLSETYLLGAANEVMGHGDLNTARALFARVVQLDPGSADGHAGLARIALRNGDRAEAARQTAIVHKIAPAYPVPSP
jgi:tetratricopeptide (TPR) repeat protein